MKKRRFLISLLLTSLVVVMSNFAPLSFAQDCPEPRLEIGGRGRVTPGLPNRIRTLPSTSGEQIGEIPAGSVFDVLAGPECAEGFLWWNIAFGGLVGWTAEGNADGYFAEPVTLSYVGLPNAKAVAWSADGTRIAVGTSDGVYLFDTGDFAAPPTLFLAGSQVDDLAFHPIAPHLLAVKQYVNERYSAAVYDLEAGRKRLILAPERPSGLVNSLTFNVDAALVALNSAGFIEVYDTETGRTRYSFQLQADPPMRLGAISPDGVLLAASDGAAVVVIPVGAGRDLLRYLDRETIDDTVLALTISPDNRGVLVGDAAGNLQLWNVTTGIYTSFIRSQRSNTSNRVNDVLFNPNNTAIYTAESDPHAVIRSFNVQTLEALQTLDFGPDTNAAVALATSPDGTQLAVVVNDTVRIVDTATFTEVAQLVLRLN